MVKLFFAILLSGVEMLHGTQTFVFKSLWPREFTNPSGDFHDDFLIQNVFMS